MFWSSVFSGLKVFLHWETYVLSIAYFIISWLPLIPFMFSNDEYFMFTKKGRLLMALQPVFIAFGTIILVGSLLPIIIGVGQRASWSLPWILLFRSPLFIVMMASVMIGMYFLAAMIPILGRSVSFLTLILGGTSLFFFLTIVNKVNPDIGITEIDPIPGFLTIIGIVIISAIITWIGTLVAAIATTGLAFLSENIAEIIMVPIASIFGFVPVYIYGAWLGLQLNL